MHLLCLFVFFLSGFCVQLQGFKSEMTLLIMQLVRVASSTSFGDVIALKRGRFLRKRRDKNKYCTVHSLGRRQIVNSEVYSPNNGTEFRSVQDRRAWEVERGGRPAFNHWSYSCRMLHHWKIA